MGIVDKNTLKRWFKRGAKPNEDQFESLIDSMIHKDEGIALEQMPELIEALDEKAPAEHGHGNYLDKTNPNLEEGEAEVLRKAMGVADPVELHDEVSNEVNNAAVTPTAVYAYATQKINNIAELRKTVGKEEGQIIELLGYYDAEDKSPSVKYRWFSGNFPDDGGKYINTGDGTWELVEYSLVNIRNFGAKGDGITDDTISISNAINSALNIYVPIGNYNHTYINCNVNAIGIKLFGDGVGKSVFKFIGAENTRSFDFTKNTSFLSNYIISRITFNGNDLASEINFYRHTDLKLNNCEFINYRGKSVVIDRSYQVYISQCKFKISPNFTPECLLYLATNAVTVDNQSYFNANRRCTAVKINDNTASGEPRAYKVAINNNVFESSLIGIEVVALESEGLMIRDNYIELVESHCIPLVVRGGYHKQLSFKDNFINQSTLCSVLIDNVDARSDINVDFNRLHRPIKINTSDYDSDFIDFRNLPSVNINRNTSKFSLTDSNVSYWNPTIVVNDKFNFSELNINRISDNRDVRHAEIKGKLYLRSESTNEVDLLPLRISKSGGSTYARTIDFNIDINQRLFTKAVTEVNSYSNDKYIINGVVRNTNNIVFNYSNKYFTTESSNLTKILFDSNNDNETFIIKGVGYGTSTNEWRVNFDLKTY